MSEKTLILNGDGTPWDVQAWEEVYSNILLPIAKWDPWTNRQVMENFTLESYDIPVRVSGDRTLPRPAVVFLPQYVSEQQKSVRFSRWNVFLRDGYVCQYCQTQCGYSAGLPRPELEHVNPRSLGGGSSFENTVTSCPSCNSSKGNMTAKEFEKKYGLKLRQVPLRPTALHPARFLRYLNDQNYRLWLKSKDYYIPKADKYVRVMRIKESLRSAILQHFEEE